MFSFEWQIFAGQVVTFLLGLALLWRIAYRPLTAVLRARADRIRNDLATAEKARTEMLSLKADYEARLANIERQVRDMLTQAAREAQQARERAIEEAREQGRDLLHRAAERAEIEKRKALMELRGELADMAVRIAERVLADTMTPELHARLVESALGQIAEIEQAN